MAAILRPFDERKCPECGGTFFVDDHANGDVVCKSCGLVVEAHVIDERSEWRTFSDKDKESTDPNRVGGPSNHLLEGGGLSTVIAKTQNDGGTGYMLNRLHARSNNPDRLLIKAFKCIQTLCENLNLLKQVEQRACEVFKEVTDSGKLKGRNMQSICAACLFLSCRQENSPRTFKEITAVLPSEVLKKDIGKCFKDIVLMLKEQAAEKTGGTASDLVKSMASKQQPADHMRRFINELRMKHDVFKVCREMLQNCEDAKKTRQTAWDGKNPISVAAAIIYIIVQLLPGEAERVMMQDIVMVTGVAEITIRAAYRDLYPELSSLLPKELSSEETLKALPLPYNAAAQ